MKKVRVPDVTNAKNQRKINALTAYDYTFAKILNDQKVDIVLVGDSLSGVAQGKKNTISVTLDQMIYHTQCVAPACDYSLLITDMPFMTYQESKELALQNATRIFQEGGAEAVKIEGGVNIAEQIEFLTGFDIPVLGHVGLTPQSYHAMGGHKVQGKTASYKNSDQVIQNALAVQKAGAFSVVIECVPEELAKEITQELTIPTIGIGCGNTCDGHIAVTHDVLGLTTDKIPSFVNQQDNLRSAAAEAIKNYCES